MGFFQVHLACVLLLPTKQPTIRQEDSQMGEKLSFFEKEPIPPLLFSNPCLCCALLCSNLLSADNEQDSETQER